MVDVLQQSLSATISLLPNPIDAIAKYKGKETQGKLEGQDVTYHIQEEIHDLKDAFKGKYKAKVTITGQGIEVSEKDYDLQVVYCKKGGAGLSLRHQRRA
jgi:hypothetical protein